MHMYQHTQSKSFISSILVFNTENDCLPSFGSFYFILTVLKYLNCIDCWPSLRNKTKLFELYYRGWRCSGMGQSFLQSFSYHLMISVQKLEIFLFISYFTSALHSMSMKPSGTKWLNTTKRYFMALDYLKGLGSFQMMVSLSFIAAWNKVLWCMQTSSCVLTRYLDMSYFWPISLCSVGIYKNPEFYFLGKYCNSGLMSSSGTFRARSNFVPFLQCEKSE